MVKIPARPEDMPVALLEANTQDILYLFAADGRAVSLPVYQLPQAQEFGHGSHWAELTGFTKRNHIAAALIRPMELEGFVFLATVGAVVKRIRLEDLPGITDTPFTVMNVPDDDALGWAQLTTGVDQVILSSAKGQTIRFEEREVRSTGLPAGGVMALKLADEIDGIISMSVVNDDDQAVLVSITDNGLAKATNLSLYPKQGRHGQGVINVRLPEGAGEVVAAAISLTDSFLYINTAAGSVKRIAVNKIRMGGRQIKPRPATKIGVRNSVTGLIPLRKRPQHGPKDE
jgi:DNA gyrase subunit A